jgi:phage terminase large subunit GpA-like protein
MSSSSDERFSDKGVVPEGTVVVTVGVDVQDDGFYWLVACWGRKLELWLPLTGRITGDMRSEEVWNALAEVLATTWLDAGGNAYRSVVSAIDVQGSFYGQCIEFVRANTLKYRLRAVRGYGVDRARAAGRSFGILRNLFRDKATGVMVTNIDTDLGKSQLSDMLSRKEPGPGYVHLPCGPNGEEVGGWDMEAVAELTAEYRRQSNVRGYSIARWYKRSGVANHRLDCLVYALAALAMSRLKLEQCELQRVEARNVGKPSASAGQRPKYGAHPHPAFGGSALPYIGPSAPKEARYGAQPGSAF